MKVLQKIKIEIPYNTAIPLLRIYPKKTKSPIKRIDVYLCALQPRYGNNLSVHQ